MKKFTVVSDPGIDDLVALVLLYKLLPKAKNCLIATFGNANEEITSRNAREFITFVAKSWQFVDGSKLPLNRTIERPWPDYFHGPDGVWGVHPLTKMKRIQSLAYYPKNNNVISLAPMRDTLKLLLEKKPNSFTIMGGAFNIEGNETKYAETNIAFDPDSAAEFFKNCDNADVKVVPLDVTRKVFWDLETVKNIPETNNINKWLKQLLLAWFDKYNHEREKSFNLHDPLAIYLDFFPESALWEKSGVEVLTAGEQRGRTVLKEENPVCNIALGVKNADEIAKNIYSLVFDL